MGKNIGIKHGKRVLNFNDTLRSKRLEKGMSQVELAELLGVTNQTIWRWEQKGESIPAGRVYDICELLGIPIPDDWLPDASNIYCRLRWIILNSPFSADSLSKTTGVPAQRLHNLCNPVYQPSMREALLIAFHLDVSVEEIWSLFPQDEDKDFI